MFIQCRYNSFHVYCRELAPGTVSLTGDRAQGDDSKHDSHYSTEIGQQNTCTGLYTLKRLDCLDNK